MSDGPRQQKTKCPACKRERALVRASLSWPEPGEEHTLVCRGCLSKLRRITLATRQTDYVLRHATFEFVLGSVRRGAVRL